MENSIYRGSFSKFLALRPHSKSLPTLNLIENVGMAALKLPLFQKSSGANHISVAISIVVKVEKVRECTIREREKEYRVLPRKRLVTRTTFLAEKLRFSV